MENCPHCMRPASGDRCPHCGGELSWTGKKGIDLPVGAVLTGGGGLRAYQIGAARGMGGFGITYIAMELNSHRRTAVKEYFPTRCAFRDGDGISVQAMPGQESMFQGGMKSFLDEGRMLLAQDDLPSVVRVMDYFQANGTAYLAMEYLDGVPLHTQMARMGGRIPASELMPRLAPLLRDVGQLHRRGVIHRDVSPDNIMWMPDGALKLLDFGSARSMENGKSMTVLMKHGFSPIEQYRSKGQGPYTDVYALAATIYYCVTGTVPPAAVERLDDDPLQPPTARGAELTVNQETALLWALSLQPGARPQSMEEFAGMLFKEEAAPRPEPEPEPVRTQTEPERIQTQPEPVQTRPGPEPVQAQPEPPGAEPPPHRPEGSPAADGSNSPTLNGGGGIILPGRLGYWQLTHGISGRTVMKVITAAVAVMAVVMAVLAIRSWRSLYETWQWGAPIAITVSSAFYTLGETGFVVCAVLLITMKRKTGPYIGTIAFLVTDLLGDFGYIPAVADHWGYTVSIGPTIFIYYAALALSAAAATLYWWVHRQNPAV